MTDVFDQIRDFWDRDSHTYDRSRSHALSDPLEAAAWRAALLRALPDPGASVLDVGAGTGALCLLAAELGYRVTALDLSEGMLARAREKAEPRGLDVSFVVGSAMKPPPGPFDAVMERHVLWTIPDPVGALRAWRGVVAPGGRLVLFEGVWGSRSPVDRLKTVAAQALRRARRTPPSHHAPYPSEVLSRLQRDIMASPQPFIRAVHDAGWTAVRIQRLRDVEWAVRGHEPWPIGWLARQPRYALIADA